MRGSVPRLLATSALGLVSVLAYAQPDLSVSGPQLKVPSPEKHLFFLKQPVVVEGTVMVPLTAVEQWLQVKVQGDRRGAFTLSYFGGVPTATGLGLRVGDKQATVARAKVPLEVAPQVIDNETFVPLRFIAEAVGTWVEPVGRQIRLRKPDEGWECLLAIPPHPKSLEGKLAALAASHRPTTPKRLEEIALSADTISGHALIAEPAETGAGVVRHTLRYQRDRTGWHFLSEEPVPPSSEAPGD